MYDDNNIFAKIIHGEIPCNKIYEDDKILAFNDINPAAPIHVLVIPKGKYVSFADFAAQAPAEEVANFFAKAAEIAKSLDTSNGYRIISNHGSDASQTVAHFHLHILAGKQLGGLIPNDELVR